MRTSIKNQRAMFLESLWRQMDRISSSSGNGVVFKAAGYLAEGYEGSEVVELLVSEGFDPIGAKSCVAMAMDEHKVSKWGFEAEDQRGDVANNFDLGMDGVAGDDEDGATEEAQVLVDTEHPGQYTITRVFVL
jgi:hypothetical protein